MVSSSSPENVLKVEHLTVRFGGLTAVSDLNFDVRTGEITGLIGPNGAGKTTVFNCITGFYKPTTGLLTMNHPDGQIYYLDRMADFRVANTARVARTFQNIRLFSGMTVLENLLVAQHNVLMRASGMSVFGILGLPSYDRAEKKAADKAAFWLDKVGLYKRADDPAGDLPYGAQRRLEIARAMCTDPLLLCLDEPAAGLNPRESTELNNLLISIKNEMNTSILLIEHDMSVVMKISDHVVVLEYGCKIADGPPAQIKTDARVIAAYLGVDDSDVEQQSDVAALVKEFWCPGPFPVDEIQDQEAGSEKTDHRQTGRVQGQEDMSVTSPLLSCRGVKAYYGKIAALRGVDIDVNEGEIVTLIGSNGAGKSTLMMTICGSPQAREGTITFEGHNITKMPTHHIARMRIAQSPEGRRIFPRMTVHENLQMGATVDNYAHVPEDLEKVFALFPRLKERINQRGGTLSGGEQQMLAIARALMSRPRLLLLDEPSLGLAPLIVKQIFEAIKELNSKEKLTVFLVEQNAYHALRLAHRGYVMVNGLVTMSGTGQELLQRPEVRAAYLEGGAH